MNIYKKLFKYVPDIAYTKHNNVKRKMNGKKNDRQRKRSK